MRFQRNETYDDQFDQVKELKWYPYVGKDFGQSGKKIMVFAHNIPVSSDVYEVKSQNWIAKDSWATSERLEEFAYQCGSGRGYTKSFRSFIKGAVGLTKDYRDIGDEITDNIDAFIRSISYVNFIQAIVESEKKMTNAQSEQIELSKRVNFKILQILGITHCICWGQPTYEYVCNLEGFKILSENHNLGKRGFSSCLIEVGEGQTMRCLRIYHPSMPRFGALQKSTHDIISSFLRE